MPRKLTSYRHKARRKNNPPAGLVKQKDPNGQAVKTYAYPRPASRTGYSQELCPQPWESAPQTSPGSTGKTLFERYTAMKAGRHKDTKMLTDPQNLNFYSCRTDIHNTPIGLQPEATIPLEQP